MTTTRYVKAIRVIVAMLIAVASLTISPVRNDYEANAAGTYGFSGEGWYNIIPACAPDKALGLSSSTISNGTNVQLVKSANATKFYFANMGNGYYAISALSSNKVLDIRGGSTKSGSNVQMYDLNFGGGQMWKVVNAGNGYYYLRPANNDGIALDVTGGKNVVGTNVEVYSWWNGNNAEKFQLYKGNSLGSSYTKVTSANNTTSNYTVLSMGNTQITVYGVHEPSSVKNYKPSVSCEFRVIIRNSSGKIVVNEVVSNSKKYNLGNSSSEYYVTVQRYNKWTTPWISTTIASVLVLENARIK